MTRPAPFIIELPPRDDAEAEARAARESNFQAFFDGRDVPEVDPERFQRFVERMEDHAADHNRFLLDVAINRQADRVWLRKILAEQGYLRREYLLMIGADPDSDDLMERPVELHHS